MKWYRHHEPSAWLTSEIARVRRSRLRPGCQHLDGRRLPVVALWAPGLVVCERCFPPAGVDAGLPDHDHRCCRCGAVDHGAYHPLFCDVEDWAVVALGLCRVCFRKEVAEVRAS